MKLIVGLGIDGWKSDCKPSSKSRFWNGWWNRCLWRCKYTFYNLGQNY